MFNNLNDAPIRPGNGEGIYLFCFARSHLPAVLNASGPDDRQAVSQLTSKGITAVFSKVSLEEFCGSEAESRMKDLSWIGPRACRHENIIERALCHSPVVPARFGTILSSLERLEKLMQIHHGKILGFLEQVADKEEWSVKGFIDSKKAKKKLFDEYLDRENERPAALSPGARYFQEKRIRNKMDKQLNSRLKGVVKGIGEALKAYASDFYQGTPLSRKATGKVVDMVLNWAFLVPQNSVAAFCVQGDRINADHDHWGLSLELSGPWPPYSFCPSLEME